MGTGQIIRKWYKKKLNPKIKFDTNAIAKGYGVDQILNFIRGLRYKDVFVEIGGELRCSGKNQQNKFWRIGIDNPNIGDYPSKEFAGVIIIDNRSLATSGNYRNFVNIDGEIIGHTINPKLGKPIQTNVLSVTVLAESCMNADGWATALMTMDYEAGKEIVRSEGCYLDN